MALLFQRLAIGGDQIPRAPLALVAGLASAALSAVGTIATMSAASSSARQQEAAALKQRQAEFAAFQADARAHDMEIEAVRAQQKAAGAELTIGMEARDAARFRADQLDMKGQEERAAAAAKANLVRRQKELAQSTLQARAAASGGSATDPTILALGAGIEKEGELQALTEFYTGDATARGYELSAVGERLTGNAEMIGAKGRYEGALATGKGMIAQAEGNYEKAKAGQILADANLMRNFAAASATRRQGITAGIEGASSLFGKFSSLKFG